MTITILGIAPRMRTFETEYGEHKNSQKKKKKEQKKKKYNNISNSTGNNGKLLITKSIVPLKQKKNRHIN